MILSSVKLKRRIRVGNKRNDRTDTGREMGLELKKNGAEWVMVRFPICYRIMTEYIVFSEVKEMDTDREQKE